MMCTAGCIENDIFLASVIWPCIALLWEGLGEFVTGFNIDKYYMVLYGYMAVAVMQTFVKEIVEIFLYLNKCNDDGEPCNELLRVFVEDVYIVMATTAVVMVWRGQLVDPSAIAYIPSVFILTASTIVISLGTVGTRWCSDEWASPLRTAIVRVGMRERSLLPQKGSGPTWWGIIPGEF